MLVRCLNCGIVWRRITGMDNPGGTVLLEDLQYYCPNCNSNAYEWKIGGEEENKSKEENFWDVNDPRWPLRNKITGVLDKILPPEIDIFPDDLARGILEDVFVLHRLKNLRQETKDF